MASPGSPPPPVFPAESAVLSLPGTAGRLEVAVDLPEADAPAHAVTAVICHPLSTEGGSMHNKVVVMTGRSLRELGVTTVRFNFRGVGESEGRFDSGEGETDDLRTVTDWVRAQRPHDRLWLAGFSFGAYVSLRATAALQPDGLISIAPPAGRWAFDRIEPPRCPWLLVQGDADEIVDPQAVYDWVDSLAHQPELVRMYETGHFFHRKLMDLRGAIKNGVKTWLPPA